MLQKESARHWQDKYVASLSRLCLPPHSEATKLDELYAYIQTRCFMSWTLVCECTSKAKQKVVDQAKKAFQFCSDGYAGYEQVNSSPSHSTSQTYSVEANNTKLRHYVSQLMRRMRAFATSARGKQLLSSYTLEGTADVSAALS